LGLVARGYLLAIVVAVPIGFALGASKLFTKCFDPIFQILRPVSPLAWYPLAGVITLSLKKHYASVNATTWQCILTIAICSLWPTVLNTAVGVRAIPQDYLNVAKVLRLGRWKTLRKIMLPASLPYMFTGFRLSLGIAWLVIVAAEMLSGKSGIGFFVNDSYQAKDYGSMIAAIGIIGFVGFVLDRLMTVVEKNVDFILGLPGLVGRLMTRSGRERVQDVVAGERSVAHAAA
jgi:nitrate/nitrite transport system permease protein